MAQLDAQSIINFIGSAPKKTFVKVYVKGKNLDSLTYPEGVDAFVESRTGILFGDWK
jgi:tetrahydrodipicolinate N-acetyltransferase